MLKLYTGLFYGRTIYMMRCYDYFLLFPLLLLYFNVRYFSDQFLNATIIYIALPCFSNFPNLLSSCSYFVFVTHYIHLVCLCCALEGHITYQHNITVETMTALFMLLPLVMVVIQAKKNIGALSNMKKVFHTFSIRIIFYVPYFFCGPFIDVTPVTKCGKI